MPLIITDRISRLVVTGYDAGQLALGLIRIRRARDTIAGGLKTNSEASNIKPYSSYLHPYLVLTNDHLPVGSIPVFYNAGFKTST